MRKRLLLPLLLFLLLNGVCQAQVDVYYLPDSGFLRVTGEVIIEPTNTSLSFLVFPMAQITEFWTDNLVDYSIQRGPNGTLVNFSIRQAHPQSLSFSYEGFLEPETRQIILGPDQLWFPELSFPIKTPEITLELPETWEFRVENGRGRYPIFQVFNTATAEIFVAEGEPSEENLPQEAIPTIDEMISRIQIQITRLTRAISQRNASDLAQLLSPSLQKEKLDQYLASLPLYHGRVTSELVDIPAHAQDKFNVVFSTERGQRYNASMVWQERAGWLELTEFRLVPEQTEIPSEVLASVDEFLQKLQNALKARDNELLESLLAPQMAQEKQEVVTFLSSLKTDQPWSIEHITLDPFSVIAFVPHLEKPKLLIDFSLIPGQYHWLIQGFQITLIN